MKSVAWIRVMAGVVVAAMAMTTGCQGLGGGQGGSGASMTDAIQRLAGEWVLKAMNGSEVASMLPSGAQPPSLNFGTDGKVSGFSGVNRLAGGFDLGKLAEGKLSFGNLASTKMAGPPEAMQVESKFTGLLAKVDGFRFVDGGRQLSLTEGGKGVLELVKGGK